MNEVYFSALGGGQRVGGSCYYLRLGSSNIILDAGVDMREGVASDPEFFSLLTSPFIRSLSQIDRIFISHAHMDHVGYLPELMKDAERSAVYMTDMTASLARYQLFGRQETGDRSAGKEVFFRRITTVSYMQTMKFREYTVSFLPAGHIPGSMMTLFEYKNRRILYTGDYSFGRTPLTEGCMIPEEKEIDVLILCALHARHPGYRKKDGQICREAERVRRQVLRFCRPVSCRVNQLSKGIEFLQMLNRLNENRPEKIDIYIDVSMRPLIEKIERQYISLMTPYTRFCRDCDCPYGPNIFLYSGKKKNISFREEMQAEFSLHEDFAEMKHFIRKINPRQAVIVHCAPSDSPSGLTIEQEILTDAECRTQFLFAEEGEFYVL